MTTSEVKNQESLCFHHWRPKERDEVSDAELPAKWVCLFHLNMAEHNGVCSVGIRKG